MIKRFIVKKIKKLFLRDLDDIKIQKAKIFEQELQKNLSNYKNINEVYFKVFSQDFEDGIIQYLLKSLKITDVKFVEIGTQDYSESNTRYLFETMRCKALLIDPFPELLKEIKKFMKIWINDLKIFNDYIDGENINKILKNYNFNKNIDLFSLDIDGIDYWVLKEIPNKISKIFIIEYNPFFGSEIEVTAPNIKYFDRFKYHKTGFCWGASLKAIIKLMKNKGYVFIGSNRLNCNAFFLNEDYLDQIKLKLPNNNDLTKYTKANFKIFKKGNNVTMSFSDIKNDLYDLEIFDLQLNKLVNINQFNLFKYD